MTGTSMILAQDTITSVGGALPDASASASATAARCGDRIEDAVERTMNDLEAEGTLVRSRHPGRAEP